MPKTSPESASETPNTFRVEKDSLGEVQVPASACYGAQTQRAVDNFSVSGYTLPEEFLRAIVAIKKAAAEANLSLGLLDSEMAQAIVQACDRLDDRDFAEQFPVDVFQTGSGTSTNMNVNEVLAHMASAQSGLTVGANDHVNMCQSSNDVIPTAIHLSALLALQNKLLPALVHLIEIIEQKAQSVQGVVKTGRTHLMDAVPIALSQELNAWAAQVRLCKERIESTLPRLEQVAQGGTAVGTGLNAHAEFAEVIAQRLSRDCGVSLRPAENPFAAIASQDTAVEVSGQLKTLAVALMKIANDLRWMNSGPLAGFGEIALPALQPGSSIMPGKVNPVIAESVSMVAAKVIGNDTTLTVAGQSGNFQLNVMLPVIAYSLLESIRILATSARMLADKAIAGFTVDETRMQEALARNPILVTALNPVIGYAKAADIAKAAYASGRPVLDVAVEMTDLSESELKQLLDPARLSRGGIVDEK
ncbi:class II fumarate hydratase [Microbulbifer hydrolyticus]|uniref:Fumarate hydratase class II n=1 Tax=Microbulbifer hydrolyticus TaxID=48074 RepID=A0A6P1TAR1_9GAMM|nr:class II fumarate hydratase [Microbulbifer hydrolyticus]MBB5210723.1 fumarate hydratase class II [Microbulbifer hydrolyticus]QHQ38825.1 aspartate ammonia-lyase [Microbulbifer hydrolyticus]